MQMIPKADKKLAADCANLNFTASSVAALLSIRTELGVDLNWSDNQIRYLSKREC